MLMLTVVKCIINFQWFDLNDLTSNLRSSTTNGTHIKTLQLVSKPENAARLNVALHIIPDKLMFKPTKLKKLKTLPMVF